MTMDGGQPLVVTSRPDGSGPYYLNHIGSVAGLAYSDTMPGGPESMELVLGADPHTRHEALSPGRRVQVQKGMSCVWEGRLLEPAAGDGGWAVTADGIGTLGKYYRADWQSGGWTAANLVARAISRGLRWIAGSLSGGYLLQPSDTGTVTVDDALNQIAATQSSTWRVSRVHAGWQCDLIALPGTTTRLLVSTSPAVRTLAGYVNALQVKYQATADKGNKPATFGWQTATLPDSITRHDRTEAFWDVTSGGVMSSSAALALGNAALAKYLAASYAGPFTVSHGQYLTAGGVPVDLACESAGEVVQLVLADGPYGGEIYPVP